MLERLGYRIEKQCYFSLGETLPSTTLRSRVARLVYENMPWLKENQTTIAVKNEAH